MIIDAPLVVKIEDAEFEIEMYGLNEWVLAAKAEENKEQSPDELVDQILSRLVAVRGCKYADGREVTLEDIKARKMPLAFFWRLADAAGEAATAYRKGEAEAKNALPSTSA